MWNIHYPYLFPYQTNKLHSQFRAGEQDNLRIPKDIYANKYLVSHLCMYSLQLHQSSALSNMKSYFASPHMISSSW